MVYKKYKSKNNSRWKLDVALSTSWTTAQVLTWEGVLFDFPMLATLERFESGKATKREWVEITNVSWDTLTIIRQVFDVRKNDTDLDYWKFPFSFENGDFISGYVVNDDNQDVKTEVARLETDKLDISVYDLEKNVFSASSEWDDDYVITDSSLTWLQDWQPIRFRADVDNTWPATLQENAWPSKPLKKNQWTEDLETWDIKADWIVTAFYNSVLDVYQFSWQIATIVVSPTDTILFWDWSDWALVVPSWTTLIAPDKIHQFSSVSVSAWAILWLTWPWVMRIKCSWNVDIQWTIELDGKASWSTIQTVDWDLIILWTGWAGWNWWTWDGNGWSWWASDQKWHWAGWAGWGWNTGGTFWWNWWDAWSPGWVWGSGWGDVGNPGGRSAWWEWGWSSWWNWWNSYWSDGSNSTGSWGWGWAAWWNTWWQLQLQAKDITWNWTINCNGWAWWNWWDANTADWSGWGWGWGWSWGEIYFFFETKTETITKNIAGWAGWSGWTLSGTWSNWDSWSVWDIWTILLQQK